MRGKKVCRMHGAFAGTKTAEGRRKQVEAVTKHGLHSKEAIEQRRQFRELIKGAKGLISQAR